MTNGAQTQAQHRAAKAWGYSNQTGEPWQAPRSHEDKEGQKDSGQQIASIEAQQESEDTEARDIRIERAEVEEGA